MKSKWKTNKNIYNLHNEKLIFLKYKKSLKIRKRPENNSFIDEDIQIAINI